MHFPCNCANSDYMFPDAAVLWFFHYYLAKELNVLCVSAALARSSQVICVIGEKKACG